MSSSSSQPAADIDCDFTNGFTDKSSGLRKWSRNLSAHRHRELNRLNQIERERQSLELKRQNDLFDQMSVTANGNAGGRKASALQEHALDSQTGRNLATTVSAVRDIPEMTANLELATVNNGSATAATKIENENKQPSDLSAEKWEIPSPTEAADLTPATELFLTSLASPEDKQAVFGERLLAAQAKSSKSGNTSILVQDRTITVDGGGGKSPDKKSTNEKNDEKLTLDQQSVVKRPITADQLTQFISSRVPENKRVLCLIVRDKMSRLNRAKSYFYPTYYLFIQAIVDIDDTGDLSLINTRGSDDDLFGASGQGDGKIAAANASADNSFSASSSISADMLFIGTNASNGAANLTNVKLSGNSYSDNEVYADTETEDDYQPQQYASADSGGNELPVTKAAASPSTTTTAKQLRFKSGFSIANKSAGSLQGRDSPLVFPNRDINNATAAIGSASNCDPGESGSLANGWPVSKDALGSLSDGKTAATAYPLGQSSRLSDSSKTSMRLNISGTSGSLAPGKSLRNQPRLRLKTAATSDGSQKDLDEDDSDNDELHFKQHTVDDDDNDDVNDEDESNRPCRNYKNNNDFIENDEEVNYGGRSTSGVRRYHCNLQQQQDLFDNERNPYTGTYGVLLAGRRRKKAKTYLIGPSEYGYTRKNSICKLKSNVLGTQFNAIRLNHSESNDRCTIASISYETNVLGFKGPRKMRVFLAKDPSKGAKNLPEMFKKNPTAVVQLKNMTPSWNVESQSYVLNFHGRVTQASVKNFQLIECEDHLAEGQRQGQLQLANTITSNARQQTLVKDGPAYNYDQQQQQQRDKKSQLQQPIDRLAANNLKEEFDDGPLDTRAINSQLLFNNIPTGTDAPGLLAGNKSPTYNSAIVMQFGRISNHEFTCDVTYPLSILQAFAIALSSFDSKLACE